MEYACFEEEPKTIQRILSLAGPEYGPVNLKRNSIVVQLSSAGQDSLQFTRDHRDSLGIARDSI